jgi:ABC-2 type transport system permease protein
LSEFEKLKIVTKYELLKHFRRKRFYGALVIVILAQILMIGLYRGLDLSGQLGVPDSPELFAIFAVSMSSFAVLAAVFFAGDAIASEFEHKTGYVLFPNPVKRSSIVVGKYLACFLATLVILGVGYVISAVALAGLYQEIPIGILGSLAISVALVCGVLGIAFFFSSLLKGGMGATIATLIIFMVVSPIIRSSLSYAGYEPWFLPDYAGDAVASTYGINFAQIFGGMTPGGGMQGMMTMMPDPVVSFFVLLIYAIVTLLVSIWLTGRRELT